ncbi:STAS domain-containing protein [Streptomyces sp. NPDC059165]|uniref:STAS domain-containing protein n=1 Tax=Streptomyces sp. NPDC059165 TaxID=3346751 RepID=UPI0036804C19
MDASSEDRSPSPSAEPVATGQVVDQYAVDGLWVVAAHGDLDLNNLPPLTDALTEASASHSTVVLDASGITFADSSFLNLVLRFHRCTTLRVAAPQAQLLRLLEITGGDQVLDIRPTLDAATVS